jgi:hypothetical protein
MKITSDRVAQGEAFSGTLAAEQALVLRVSR